MIEPAPADFWNRVIDRVAKLIWERETNGIKLNPAFAVSCTTSQKTSSEVEEVPKLRKTYAEQQK